MKDNCEVIREWLSVYIKKHDIISLLGELELMLTQCEMDVPAGSVAIRSNIKPDIKLDEELLSMLLLLRQFKSQLDQNINARWSTHK